MKICAIIVVSLAVLAACGTTTAGLSPAEKAKAATSPAAMEALDARELTNAEIEAELIDRPLDAGPRIWMLSPSGSFTMRAKDGSGTTSGVWDIRVGKLCTATHRCGKVYELAGVYRWASSAETLAPWPITAR